MAGQAEEIQALKRLLKVAAGDTNQSEIVSNFLLAWWNSKTCGGFNLTDVWGVDYKIKDDMVQVFSLIAAAPEYPSAYGFSREFQELILAWRPKLSRKRSA